jgi:hypothetical protein
VSGRKFIDIGGDAGQAYCGFCFGRHIASSVPKANRGQDVRSSWTAVQWAERFRQQQRAFYTAGARQALKSDRRRDQDN